MVVCESIPSRAPFRWFVAIVLFALIALPGWSQKEETQQTQSGQTVAGTIAAAAVGASPTVAAPGAKPDYEQDLGAFIREIDSTYPFFDLKGIRDDWKAASKRLREEVKNCKSDEAFLGIVVEAMKSLRDSHMGITKANAKLPPPPPEFCPGISFLPATNDRVVVMYPPPGADADLKTGAVVTRIDGKDARSVLEERAKAAWTKGGFYSSRQRARLFEYRIPLCGEKGKKHTITILVGEKEREIELTSNVEARGWPHTYNMPKGLTPAGRSCWFTKLPSGVGYIYLRRVDESVAPGIAKAVSAHPDAKGWIVDFCGNSGGGYDNTLLEQVKSLPRPVACLLDAGCISAGETLARDFVNLTQARLFGSTTGGASSSKRSWTFPSGVATLSLPTRSRWGIEGKMIEFNGIEPHVAVEAVPEEVQRGLNSAILRAEEYLTSASAGSRPKSVF
jgi:C-terminal processing protease CtpA/Prc